MTNVDGPRLATEDDFDEMMDLLDRYFAYERGGMAARLPFCYDPARSDRHAIIEADGRIVSHVAAIPQTLSVGDGTVECWGIGGVATDRRYRGNGYMSELLEFWLDRMDEAAVPLSDLSGNRQRYAHFGYENAGSEYRYVIDERSFAGTPMSAADLVRYDRNGERFDVLRSIHDAEPYRVVRDRGASETVFGQRGLETLVYDGEDPAYLSLTRESRARTVEEFGGSDRGVERLLSHVLAVYDLNELTVRAPPVHPLADAFARHSRHWTNHPHRKLRICDLRRVLEAFRGQIEERWDRSGRTERGGVTLGLADSDTGDAVRLAYDEDSVSIERSGADPDRSLNRSATTAFLFGQPERVARRRRRDPFLETVLPLRFYLWPTEHV